MNYDRNPEKQRPIRKNGLTENRATHTHVAAAHLRDENVGDEDNGTQRSHVVLETEKDRLRCNRGDKNRENRRAGSETSQGRPLWIEKGLLRSEWRAVANRVSESATEPKQEARAVPVTAMFMKQREKELTPSRRAVDAVIDAGQLLLYCEGLEFVLFARRCWRHLCSSDCSLLSLRSRKRSRRARGKPEASRGRREFQSHRFYRGRECYMTESSQSQRPFQRNICRSVNRGR